MKKTRGRKSRVRVPLTPSVCTVYWRDDFYVVSNSLHLLILSLAVLYRTVQYSMHYKQNKIQKETIHVLCTRMPIQFATGTVQLATTQFATTQLAT
jgi:hypothetical protein